MIDLDEPRLRALCEKPMIDPASSEFVLSASPTAEIDAQEAFGRVLTGETAPLRDRAMLLISGLLTSEEGPPITTADDVIAVKVISAPRSIRIEITDAGSGVVLGGLRTPALTRREAGAPISSAGSPIDGASSPARKAPGSGSSSTSRGEQMNLEMASLGLDPAISLAERLRRECRADVVDVDPLPAGITIHLAIPRSGLIPMNRLRRDLWMSFVSRACKHGWIRWRGQATHRLPVGSAGAITGDHGAQPDAAHARPSV